jgi:hypothetical protein
MVAEVNWEGCHHRDRWSSLLPNCRMVLTEKETIVEARKQVVTMTAPETIVQAREKVVTMTVPKTIVEAHKQVVTMTAPAPRGLSDIHRSRGFNLQSNVVTSISSSLLVQI